MRFRWLIVFSLLAAQLHAGVLARFKMNRIGTVDVELYELDKPVTVSNFVAYVKAGAWHDNIMHRWVHDFVIQGGSYKVPHQETDLSPLSVNPAAITTFPAITNEYSVGRTFSNVYGTIAMARIGGQTNSATSSWFFNVANNVNLDSVDGGFTVFGRTLAGTNVLNLFRAATATNMYFLSATSETPVYSTDGATGFWLNVDVTVLTAQITKATGGWQISWNSVENRQNIVEYTTTIPAVWKTAEAVTGTGGTMSITNNPGTDAFRHYRVRIDYSN